MLFARIIHALCEAELVRGIFFGEGGLNSQQWGIVSIRRVQPPGSAAEPLNCPIHWIQRPFGSFRLLLPPFASGTNRFEKLTALRSNSCYGNVGKIK